MTTLLHPRKRRLKHIEFTQILQFKKIISIEHSTSAQLQSLYYILYSIWTWVNALKIEIKTMDIIIINPGEAIVARKWR